MEFYLFATWPIKEIPVDKLIKNFKVVSRKPWTKVALRAEKNYEVVEVVEKLPHRKVKNLIVTTKGCLTFDGGKGAFDVVNHSFFYQSARIFIHRQLGVFLSKGIANNSTAVLFSNHSLFQKLEGVEVNACFGRDLTIYDVCAQMSKNQLYYIQAKQRTLVRIDLDELSDAISTGKEYTPQQIDTEVGVFSVSKENPELILYFKLPSKILLQQSWESSSKKTRITKKKHVGSMKSAFEFTGLALLKSHFILAYQDHIRCIVRLELRRVRDSKKVYHLDLIVLDTSNPMAALQAVESEKFRIVLARWDKGNYYVMAVKHQRIFIIGQVESSLDLEKKSSGRNFGLKVRALRNPMKIEVIVLGSPSMAETHVLRF